MLPDDFVFSQHSLQDFVDCPYHFYLRYILGLAWPAVMAEPILEQERRIRLGMMFHRMAHQHFLGIPSERLTAMAADEKLRLWWQNFLESKPGDTPGNKFPEITVSARLDGWGLTAKYDLLAISPDGAATIYDWKTSEGLPKRTWLKNRLQTRVYRYLLLQNAGRFDPRGVLDPDQIEMVYWYSNFPNQPIHFPYSAEEAEDDLVYLNTLITKIVGMGEDEFIKTDHDKRCKYCRHRSYCDRGEEAGTFDELPEFIDVEEDYDLDLDFDQIAEIEF